MKKPFILFLLFTHALDGTTELDQQMKNFAGRVQIYFKCLRSRSTCSAEERKAARENILYDGGKLILVVGTLLTGTWAINKYVLPFTKRKKRPIKHENPIIKQPVTPATQKTVQFAPPPPPPLPNIIKTEKIVPKPQDPIQSKEEPSIAASSPFIQRPLLSLPVVEKINKKISLENKGDVDFLGYELESEINGITYYIPSSIRYPQEYYAAFCEIEINQYNWIDMGIYYATKEKAQAFEQKMNQFVQELQKDGTLPQTLELNCGVKQGE